jgi:catechol 2,3-dioxygenase-like lactoylglutathione lyase family enzyme
MAISEIHHVALAVSDMERSIAFYCDILGFRKTLDMPLGSPGLERLLRLRPGTTGRSVILQQGVSTIGEVELVQFSPPPSTPTPAKGAGGLGAFLLSFEVKNEELDAVYQRLQKKGVACYSDPQVVELKGYGSMRAIVFEDPDGQMIELIQLPSADEVQRVREAYHANKEQPTA